MTFHQRGSRGGEPLKILPHHYEHMRLAILRHHHAELWALAQATGLSAQLYRWDLLALAGLGPFVHLTLHKYLTDAHIDSALRRITDTPLEKDSPR